MDKDKMNISSIETYLNSIFDNNISDNTIFGYMIEKATIPDDWNDMVLIEVPNGVADMDAYGQGTILIWLYARPRSNGSKNVATMSKLEENLNFVIKNASNKDYSISRGVTYSDYDSIRQWHCNVVELNILIV